MASEVQEFRTVADLVRSLEESGELERLGPAVLIQGSAKGAAVEAQAIGPLVEALAQRTAPPDVCVTPLLQRLAGVVAAGCSVVDPGVLSGIKVMSPCFPGGMDVPRTWLGDAAVVTVVAPASDARLGMRGVLRAQAEPLFASASHPARDAELLIAEGLRLGNSDLCIAGVACGEDRGQTSQRWFCSRSPLALEAELLSLLWPGEAPPPYWRFVEKSVRVADVAPAVSPLLHGDRAKVRRVVAAAQIAGLQRRTARMVDDLRLGSANLYRIPDYLRRHPWVFK